MDYELYAPHQAIESCCEIISVWNNSCVENERTNKNNIFNG